MRRLFRRRLTLAVLFGAVALDAAILVAACSSSSPNGFGEDGGNGPTTDGGADSGKDGNAPKPDSGKQGNCTPVKGACNLVLQDCPNDPSGQPQECVVMGSTAATTGCVSVTASEQLPMGHACCPSQSANPCLPGLTCVGNACADGGPQTGRCSPACCAGDDTACGKSVPEGIAGSCDFTIVDQNQNPLYDVCSYAERCKPYGIEPCTAGETCQVQDSTGSASCFPSNGLEAGAPCNAGNDCADGLICAGGGGADASCLYTCLVPNSTSPFDASVSQGAPGKGGCPGGSVKCNIIFTGLPSWFGACGN